MVGIILVDFEAVGNGLDITVVGVDMCVEMLLFGIVVGVVADIVLEFTKTLVAVRIGMSVIVAELVDAYERSELCMDFEVDSMRYVVEDKLVVGTFELGVSEEEPKTVSVDDAMEVMLAVREDLTVDINILETWDEEVGDLGIEGLGVAVEGAGSMTEYE